MAVECVVHRRPDRCAPLIPGGGRHRTIKLSARAFSAARKKRFSEGSCSMPNVKEAASEFLASRRVAVTGVSREPKRHGSNVVYRRLRDRGYDVFPVNPNAD